MTCVGENGVFPGTSQSLRPGMPGLTAIPRLTECQERLLLKLAYEEHGEMRLTGADLHVGLHLGRKALLKWLPNEVPSRCVQITDRGIAVAAALAAPRSS